MTRGASQAARRPRAAALSSVRRRGCSHGVRRAGATVAAAQSTRSTSLQSVSTEWRCHQRTSCADQPRPHLRVLAVTQLTAEATRAVHERGDHERPEPGRRSGPTCAARTSTIRPRGGAVGAQHDGAPISVLSRCASAGRSRSASWRGADADLDRRRGARRRGHRGCCATTWRRSHSSRPSEPARNASAQRSTCTAEPMESTWSSGRTRGRGSSRGVETAPDGPAPPAEGAGLAVRPGARPAQQPDRDEPAVALLEGDVVDVADHLLLTPQDLVVEQAQPEGERGPGLDRPAGFRCRGSLRLLRSGP